MAGQGNCYPGIYGNLAEATVQLTQKSAAPSAVLAGYARHRKDRIYGRKRTSLDLQMRLDRDGLANDTRNILLSSM
jgi:hypothetical protein